jgi:hypothetical protein
MPSLWVLAKKMERIKDDSGVKGERQRPLSWWLLARLDGAIAVREVAVPVSEQQVEPRAGYYVASQSRPAYVTNMTSAEIAQVFDLVEKVSKLPPSHPADANNGAPHSNGNGTARPNEDGTPSIGLSPVR